jgi:hypothetical protein
LNNSIYKSFESSISKERLEKYSFIFDTTDKTIIIHKYLLNTELSKALYFPIQTLETTLRNNIHNVLSKQLGNEKWFEDKEFLNPRLKIKIDDAKRKIHKSKELTSGRIISELSFGFWTYLFAREYEQKIWNKNIKQIFPNIPKKFATRRNLSERINTIRNLRNKVFHFDTIIHIKNLFEIHKELIEMIYWLNKDIYDLTIEFDEFENVYNNEEKIIKEKLDNLCRSANDL